MSSSCGFVPHQTQHLDLKKKNATPSTSEPLDKYDVVMLIFPTSLWAAYFQSCFSLRKKEGDGEAKRGGSRRKRRGLSIKEPDAKYTHPGSGAGCASA